MNTSQKPNKIKVKTIFVHIMTIYIGHIYIYYHDMYKNEQEAIKYGLLTKKKCDSIFF